MRLLFDLLLVLFAGFWLFQVSRGIRRSLKRGEKTNWVVAAMGLLVLTGFGGFFAAALAAEGILKLPNSFEWPAGYVEGVKTLPDGKSVVPLEPSGRLQIYDPNWRFLRGWHVDAHAGRFRVECPSSGLIEVYTGRGNHHYTYKENGQMVSSMTYSEGFSWPPEEGSYIVVPTTPIGWVFSSPFISWSAGVLGFIGLALVKKFTNRTANQSVRP
ncbi:MAG TPA: hypothetical protein VLA42_05580 [Verrucomicrobiae bacterium]|jgi:hypothetical protein|nr:hypothetical protein [Verrucomicrobiae bacterium]